VTLTATSSLAPRSVSCAVTLDTWTPGASKVAIVAGERRFPNASVPGPLTASQ
jgi:hypothetical protein